MNKLTAVVGTYEIDENKMLFRAKTSKAAQIVSGLRHAGADFFAEDLGNEILSIVLSSSDLDSLNQVVQKTTKSTDEAKLIEHIRSTGDLSDYEKLLPEIAGLLCKSVSALEKLPMDMKITLVQVYVNYWYSPDAYLISALEKVIDLEYTALDIFKEAEEYEFYTKRKTFEKTYIVDYEKTIQSDSDQKSENETHGVFNRKALRNQAAVIKNASVS